MQQKEIILGKELYNVTRHPEINTMFIASHRSGIYKLAKQRDGLWKAFEWTPMAGDLVVDDLGKEIEKHFSTSTH